MHVKNPRTQEDNTRRIFWGHTRAKLKQKMAPSFKTDPVSENEDTVLKKVKEQMNTSDPWNIFKLYTWEGGTQQIREFRAKWPLHLLQEFKARGRQESAREQCSPATSSAPLNVIIWRLPGATFITSPSANPRMINCKLSSLVTTM